MRRYLVLYLYFLRFSFSRAMQFRFDFFFKVAMDVLYYATNMAFFTILFDHTSMLGRWNLDEVYVFVCTFLFIDAVHMAVFANNLEALPGFVRRGDLDYYLVRPVSSLFFLSVRDFAANSFLNALIASGLLVWSILHLDQAPSPSALAWFVVMLFAGSLVCFLVRLAFVIPVFWLQSNRGLSELSFALDHLSERPHHVYTGAVRMLLVTVLPLAFFSSMPAAVVLDGPSASVLGHTALVVLGTVVFVGWFWRRAVRAYGSASS